MRYIVDDIKTVVDAMKAGSIATNPPFYQWGRRAEIAAILAAMDKQVDRKNQKYPVVALILDTDEKVEALTQWDLTIVIATISKTTLTSKERYDTTIRPILVPLYEQFLQALKRSGLFSWTGSTQHYPPHVRTIRPYWGTPSAEKNDRLILEDPLDAIEITDLKINSTNKPNCI